MAAAANRPGIVLQHADDAPPALLGDWLDRRGIAWRLVDVPRDGPPAIEGAPWLVVLGSHRSATDARPAWIPAERELLREAVRRELPTFGICFGGQALALALGGEVEPSSPLEASWDSDLEILGDEIPSGPWLNFHLERFTLPPGARILARSAAGVSAYRHGPHLGVQFHPEATPEIANAWAADYRPAHPWIDAERLAGDGEAAREGARRRAFGLFAGWWRAVTVRRNGTDHQSRR